MNSSLEILSSSAAHNLSSFKKFQVSSFKLVQYRLTISIAQKLSDLVPLLQKEFQVSSWILVNSRLEILSSSAAQLLSSFKKFQVSSV